mmetsp:Transcript_26554/g.106321  ORF Transcript_26554/g.106321 Transcript_26554/m.106321 type:complete len:127 (-) Transcript_26554:496-876(-)
MLVAQRAAADVLPGARIITQRCAPRSRRASERSGGGLCAPLGVQRAPPPLRPASTRCASCTRYASRLRRARSDLVAALVATGWSATRHPRFQRRRWNDQSPEILRIVSALHLTLEVAMKHRRESGP